MDGQNPKFSIIIASSKSTSERIKKTIAFREDIAIQLCPLHSLTSRSFYSIAPNLLICEYREIEGENALRSLTEIRSRYPLLPIFIITSTPNHTEAVKLLKTGVQEYLALPEEQSKLYELMESKIDEWKSTRTRKSFREEQRKSYDFQSIVGSSTQLQSVIARSRKLLSNANITVLIQGETGTGKELLAKAIHHNSLNSDQPFVEIACSSIPDSLLESELFGHEKGAFTDAKNQKIGLFELAGKGTIFLDEIGDISPAIQSKLLNALEEKKIRRLGGIEDIPVHARIITATSKDLQNMVKNGTMRKDLYYRLAVFSLVLPPLRERSGDIPLLAKHFLHDFAKENAKQIRGFTPKALEKLAKEPWEGNVRELKHAIERAVLLTTNERLDEDDLEMIPKSGVLFQIGNGESWRDKGVQLSDTAITISLPLADASLSQVEKELVREVLKQMRGNKKKASGILKISRPRLDRLINDDPEKF